MLTNETETQAALTAIRPKLPSTERARLPNNYKDAKRALDACVSIDECKGWADKAQALASYAKQAKDVELMRMAQRVRARAVRRCGQLLKSVPSQRGGDRRTKGRNRPVDRKAMARQAGLSPHQARQATRVANVPEELFAKTVDASPTPATVDKLAKLGTKPAPANGKQQALRAAGKLVLTVQAFADVVDTIDLVAAAHVMTTAQVDKLTSQVKRAQSQLAKIAYLMRTPKARALKAA